MDCSWSAHASSRHCAQRGRWVKKIAGDLVTAHTTTGCNRKTSHALYLLCSHDQSKRPHPCPSWNTSSFNKVPPDCANHHYRTSQPQHWNSRKSNAAILLLRSRLPCAWWTCSVGSKCTWKLDDCCACVLRSWMLLHTGLRVADVMHHRGKPVGAHDCLVRAHKHTHA